MTKLLTRDEREALCIAYKQFVNLDEVPEYMDLHSTSGHYLGSLRWLTTKDYTLKGEGIKIEPFREEMLVEFRDGEKGYVYLIIERSGK